MSAFTAKLLSQFDALQIEEKQEFLREVILHLPRWDSGPLSDEVPAAAGDEMAAMLDQEERCS
jgi:predicted metallopeptidase